MLDHKDDPLRRFLERATADPGDIDLTPVPLAPPSPHRLNRVVLAAAAAIVVLTGTLVLTRRSPIE